MDMCRTKSRGEWLVQWCALNDLSRGNTFFDHHNFGAWTYRNDNLLLQNDYIIFDKGLFRLVSSCRTHPDIDTGSDHRCVSACLRLMKNEKPPCRNRSKSDKQWSPDNKLYKDTLDIALGKIDLGQENEDSRQETLERLMIEAAAASRSERHTGCIADPTTEEIRKLIQIRRSIVSDRCLSQRERDETRRKICKRIQKLLRKRLQMQKQEKIASILREFCGLKTIAAIKGSESKTSIPNMQNQQGETVTD